MRCFRIYRILPGAGGTVGTEAEELIEELEGCVRRTLRESDVYVRYGQRRILALLPDTDIKESGAVAARLRKAWKKGGPGKPELVIHTSPLSGINSRKGS